MSAPEPLALLQTPPGAFLSPEQARRATCLSLALALVAGRSVPIHVVERIAGWIYDGERKP